MRGFKLTERQVRQIHELYWSGEHTLRSLGQMFGVTDVMILHIVKGKCWKEVYADYSHRELPVTQKMREALRLYFYEHLRLRVIAEKTGFSIQHISRTVNGEHPSHQHLLDEIPEEVKAKRFARRGWGLESPVNSEEQDHV